jgi:hypothetical protein
VILIGDLFVNSSSTGNVEIVKLNIFTHVQTCDFVVCVSFTDLYHFIYVQKNILIGDLFEKETINVYNTPQERDLDLEARFSNATKTKKQG